MLKKSLLLMTLTACLVAAPACSKRDAKPAEPAVAIPASSPLAKIQMGMTEVDVRNQIGEPSSSRSYMTGKAWMPYYYGGDTSRTAWTYAGQGEVVFSRNRYTGGLKVIRVDYKPEVQ